MDAKSYSSTWSDFREAPICITNQINTENYCECLTIHILWVVVLEGILNILGLIGRHGKLCWTTVSTDTSNPVVNIAVAQKQSLQIPLNKIQEVCKCLPIYPISLIIFVLPRESWTAFINDITLNLISLNACFCTVRTARIQYVQNILNLYRRSGNFYTVAISKSAKRLRHFLLNACRISQFGRRNTLSSNNL